MKKEELKKYKTLYDSRHDSNFLKKFKRYRESDYRREVKVFSKLVRNGVDIEKALDIANGL